MNIYLWVLPPDKSWHLCLLRRGLCIQYLQVCGLHTVICCIWSRSLVCDCLRSECCQTLAALKLQDKQQSFDNVPLLTSNSAETLRRMIHFTWKTLQRTEMSDLATALSTILSTLFKVILHLESSCFERKKSLKNETITSSAICSQKHPEILILKKINKTLLLCPKQ